MKTEQLTPYEEWLQSYCRASDHLLLSALLRDYYDEIDDLIDSWELIQEYELKTNSFVNEMLDLEETLHRKLEDNNVMDLYKLRQNKNKYIAELKLSIK